MTQKRGPGGVRTTVGQANLRDQVLNPKRGWYCKACHKGPQYEEPCDNCGRDMHGRPTE